MRSARDGGDPAAVAYDAVNAGTDLGADVVLIDTAGRLQNKAGLMDEPGQGEARRREEVTGRRGAAGARRHHRAERHAAGPGVQRGRARHRHRAHQGSTARPRAASSSPCSASSACR
nr:hypothetical protein [Angustibacter aerolatus]